MGRTGDLGSAVTRGKSDPEASADLPFLSADQFPVQDPYTEEYPTDPFSPVPFAKGDG